MTALAHIAVSLAPGMDHTLTADAAELAELTRRMAVGDDDAWRAFDRDYGPFIFRVLLAGARGDPHLAAEARQRAYLRISRYVRACDQPAMWFAWLRTVSLSALRDARRRELSFLDRLRRRAAEPEPEADETAESALFAALETALTLLAPDTRALVEGKYLHGKSVQELGTELGLSNKAVESRLTRARQELRELLARLPAAT